MSTIKNANQNKTITSGSDSSGGFIVGPGKKPAATAASAASTTVPLHEQAAAGLIENAMRGLAKGVMEALASSKSETDTDSQALVSEATALDIPSTALVDTLKDILSNDTVSQGLEGSQDESIAAVDVANVPPDMGEGIPAFVTIDEPLLEAVVLPTNLKEAEEIRRQNAKAIEPANIPLSVPNYHEPTEETTKICATCKYFKARTAKTGDCFAFDFTALSEYTCDAWEMTPIETNGVDSTRVTMPEEKRISDKPQPNPTDLPDAYQHIQFYPTDDMAECAKEALRVRNSKSPSERGLSAYGLSVAARIANRQFLSPDVWRKILHYFEAHQQDRQSSDWQQQGPLWQTWYGWGGDPGFREAQTVIAAVDEADERAAAQELNLSSPEPAAPAQKAREIIQASAPTSERAGGEIITGDFEPKTAEALNIAEPERFASNTTPELSRPHGHIKGSAGFYLPDERVYSKSMRSLGDVVRSENVQGMVIYQIKLIDSSGLVTGHAVVHEDDLTPRSMRAIKRMEVKTVREIVESKIDGVIKTILDACVRHEDLAANPIRAEELEAIEAQVKNLLASDDMAAASSKMGMRKYVRALQDVQHSLGGAANILRGAEEFADDPEAAKEIDLLLEKAQQNAYRRLDESAIRAKECLLEEVPMRSFQVKT